ILRLPLHTSLVVAALWLAGIATMTTSALLLAPLTEAIRGAVLSTLAALASVGYNYLFVDRAIRPAMAQTLLAAPRTHIPHSSVMTRLTVSWLLSTALPLLAALILLNDAAAQPTDRIRAATWLAAVALLAGVIVEFVLARAVALPLRHLRVALEKMGSADIDIPVDDSSEIGLLQSTVNEMSRALDERHRLHELFARHVGRHVAARAVATGDPVDEESRNVTALFVDVRDSTTMANVHSAHDVVAKLNRLFSDVITATERHGGLVNKFQGDAALCIFGAPRDLADDATAALQTARKIRDDTLHHAELDIGIGLDKGIVFAGNLGTEQRLEYTVIGDTVNQAARLSDLAKHMPGRILASDALIQAATPEERQHWRPHNAYTLRGRPTPTSTWTNVASQGVARTDRTRTASTRTSSRSATATASPRP
ncbi:adenylate cyclase, partial [Mycobacterium sp. 852002-51163_SCH5372311]|uniref:adenylate/guanylate cyclase domain-containing protein n=1 Tax=Mycobacterium sp. 852002-51163_SCH5372311 TaxID=1834097 RepID=UPI0007FDACB6